MKHVIHLSAVAYHHGLGVLGSTEGLTGEERDSVARVYPSQEAASHVVDMLNDYLESEDLFTAVPYMPDVSKPRVQRFPRHYFYGHWLAKNCLLSEDFAERKLPQVLGHNKRPDTLIFMMQLAQRYPIFSEKLKAKHP